MIGKPIHIAVIKLCAIFPIPPSRGLSATRQLIKANVGADEVISRAPRISPQRSVTDERREESILLSVVNHSKLNAENIARINLCLRVSEWAIMSIDFIKDTIEST